jgi:hypothetical protein
MSNISIDILKSAYLSVMDNLLTLDCYSYYDVKDSWKNWNEDTWVNFIYIVKEHLKVENNFWLDNLPQAWDRKLWGHWDVFVELYIKSENTNAS